MHAPAISATAGQRRLFLASFITLIAAGVGFSIRSGILDDWGREFGFTQTEKPVRSAVIYGGRMSLKSDLTKPAALGQKQAQV